MTMTLVSTLTVGTGGVTSLIFDNLPQTATDLLVVASIRTDYTGGTEYAAIFVNANGADYSGRALFGNGSSASAYLNSGIGSARWYIKSQDGGATADTFGSLSMYIPNYTSSYAKAVAVESVSENNATLAQQGIYAGLWNNTSAITRIQVNTYNGGLVNGSTASVYTITKGSGGATIA